MYTLGGLVAILVILFIGASGCTVHPASSQSALQQANSGEPALTEIPTLPGQYVAAPVRTPGVGSGGAVTPALNGTLPLLSPAALTTINGTDLDNSTRSRTIPGASFSADNTTGFAPLTVKFTDSSSNTPASWSWQFGDNSTSGRQNPTHTYWAAGRYTVTFTECSHDGCAQRKDPDYISVYKPAFSATPASGSAPLAVTFTDTGSGYPEPTAWYWDFGDGTTSTARDTTHQYMLPGTYDVHFWIAGPAGTAWVNQSSAVTVT
jgi:PKD repeat protein